MSDWLAIFLAFLVMIGTALATLGLVALGINAIARIQARNDKDRGAA